MTVFISHSTKDDKFVDCLTKALQEAGVEVWHDKTGLVAGRGLNDQIRAAIQASNAVIVVASPDALVSHWVQEEIDFAHSIGKRIIPLRMAGAPTTLPHPLTKLVYIDCSNTNQFDQHVRKVLRAIPGPSIPWRVILRAISSLRKPWRIKVFFLVVLGALLLIGALLLFPDNNGSDSPTITASETPTSETSPTIAQTATLEPTSTSVTPSPPAQPTVTIPITPPNEAGLLFLYPDPTYFVIRIDPDRTQSANLTGLSFQSRSLNGNTRSFALEEFDSLATLLNQLPPGTCLVFYDGNPPAQVPPCMISQTYSVPLDDPTRQKFWLAENALFSVYQDDALIETCPIAATNPTCQVAWK